MVLEDQIQDGKATKTGPARLARLDQKIAYLTAQLKAAKKMEAKLWRELWQTPQATQWERLKWTREVALYVRWQVLAELGDHAAAKEARQHSNNLGLNPSALLRLRWRIAGASEPTFSPAKPTSGSSSKDRRGFTVVRDDSA